MDKLFISAEAQCNRDFERSGIYRYTEDPSFRIQFIAIAVNNEPVQILDLKHGETIPDHIKRAFTSPKVRKVAYEAQNTRIILSKVLGMKTGSYLPPDQWECIRSKALYNGFPGEMRQLSRMLGVPDTYSWEMLDIMRLSRNINRKTDCPENEAEWKLYKECHRAKLESIRVLSNRLDAYNMPESEWHLYHVSQKINDRGVKVDVKMASNAIRIYDEWRKDALERFYLITGVADPKWTEQFKYWLEDHGVFLPGLSRDTVLRNLPKYNYYPVNSALNLWLQLNRTSIDKYQRILDSVSNDGRLRGCFTYCGAAAGRFGNGPVQIDNLPVSRISELGEMRDMISSGDDSRLKAFSCTVPTALAELITTVFIPNERNSFHAMTYRALEQCVQDSLFGEYDLQKLYHRVNIALGVLSQRTGMIRVGKLVFRRKDKALEILLPSGRALIYRGFSQTEDGLMKVYRYDDHHRWSLMTCKAEKIANDIVTAVARDVLADRIAALEDSGRNVVMFYPGTIVTEYKHKGDKDEAFPKHLPEWAEFVSPCRSEYHCHHYLEKSADTKRNY